MIPWLQYERDHLASREIISPKLHRQVYIEVHRLEALLAIAEAAQAKYHEVAEEQWAIAEAVEAAERTP